MSPDEETIFSPRPDAFPFPGSVARELLFWLLLHGLSTAILLRPGLVCLRLPAGLLFILLPGFLLLSVLWPPAHPDTPALLWRLALILPAGIALLGLVLLGVHYLATYSFVTVVVLVGFLDCLLLVLAYLRARRPLLGLSRQARATTGAMWHRSSLPVRLLFACSLVSVVLSVVHAAISPPQPLPLTEFYVRTPDGMLPLALPASQLAAGGLKVGIVNREGKPVSYRLAVNHVTAGTLVERWSADITLAGGTSFERTIAAFGVAPPAGELNFLLYRADLGYETPYRSLRLLLEEP